ncbi:LysR family transcriptional regulator [Seohaeicola zhoushanensis]
MQVLLALALAGSTARAGLRLGLSHQTVARRLTRLEARLGALLVDRGQTAWRLTPLGKRWPAKLGKWRGSWVEPWP